MYTNSVYHFICIPICIPLLKRLPKNTIENYRLRRMNRYYLISIIKMIIEHYRKGSDVPQLHHLLIMYLTYIKRYSLHKV